MFHLRKILQWCKDV